MSEAKPATRLMVLLFSDIVGSTALKARVGTTAYSRMLARHDHLFRQIAADFPGAHVLKDTGDGYFASFASASDAVRAALLFQYALAHEPWGEGAIRTRIGIHLGEVVEIEEEAGGRPKVVGVAADIAARIMTLAQGGQILLTDVAFNEARQYVDRHPPVPPALAEAGVGGAPTTTNGDLPDLRWVAHGPYLFKGADDRVEVFEVGAIGVAPLSPPAGNDKAKRAVAADEEGTLGWRPAVGLEVPGRAGWVLERRLGEGGFGEVWLARRQRLGQRRVFKFCYEEDRLRSLKREVTLFRLMREALGERKDIARIYEVRLDEPPFFLETEYTEGGDLTEWARQQGGIGRVPPRTRIDLVARTADAVAAAHSVGIFHKDIKPANVLVYQEEGQPRPRLADFGIGAVRDRAALHGHNITVTGFTVATREGPSTHSGTQMYLPPEVLTGKPFTMQGDIYSLGVLLYQMTVGELDRPLAVGWERDVEDELLRDDIAACVDGDPARRLSAAGELARRLRTLGERREQRRLAHDAVLAERRRQVESRHRAARRRRLLYLSMATALCLVALTVAWQHERRRRFQLQSLSESERSLKELALVEQTKAVAEKQNAESERNRAEQAKQAALEAQATAELRSAESMAFEADALTESGRWHLARLKYDEAYDEFVRLGKDPLLAEVGYAKNCRAAPPPVVRWTGVDPPAGQRLAWELKVTAVAFCPTDGSLAVSGGTDKAVKLWDVRTGKLLKRFDGHKFHVLAVAFSPDGRFVVSTSENGEVKLWPVEGGAKEAVSSFEGHQGAVYAVAFRPGGASFATGGADGTIRLWPLGDPSAGHRVLGRHGADVFALSFDRDGRRLVSGGGNQSLRLWDVESGRWERLGDHEDDVTAVAFCPDGDRVVSGGRNGQVRVWGITGRWNDRLGDHRQRVNALALSPDGRYVVSAGADNVVRLWDINGVREVAVFSGLSKPVNGVAFCPQGRRIIAGGNDWMIAVWDVLGEGKLVTPPDHAGPIRGLAFSPDSRLMATVGRDRVLRLWDVASDQILRATPVDGDGEVSGASISPDGRLVAVGVGSFVRLWRVADGKELPPLAHTGAVRDVAFAPDGRLAAATADGRVTLWDVARAEALKSHVTRMALNSVSFSPDGKFFVAGCEDMNAKVVPIDHFDKYRTYGGGHFGKVAAAAFYPDSRRFLTTGHDGCVFLWDVRTPAFEYNFVKDHTKLGFHDEPVHALAIAADGRLAATGGQDGTIKLWDLGRGREMGTLGGDRGAVHRLAFSPDGRQLVAAGEAGRVRSWELDRLVRERAMIPRNRHDDVSYYWWTKREPAGPEELAAIGEWYAFRGADDWAAEFFERARAAGGAVDPRSLARCYWRLGRADDARREFRLALDAGGADGELAHLALCLNALGDRAGPSSSPSTTPPVPATKPAVATPARAARANSATAVRP